MTQDELKKAVGWAALQYVQPGTIVGVGTGSTAAHFIDALGIQLFGIEQVFHLTKFFFQFLGFGL